MSTEAEWRGATQESILTSFFAGLIYGEKKPSAPAKECEYSMSNIHSNPLSLSDRFMYRLNGKLNYLCSHKFVAFTKLPKVTGCSSQSWALRMLKGKTSIGTSPSINAIRREDVWRAVSSILF